MKLEHYRSGYDYFSGKVSDATRQLAFSGIAVVWIFRVGEGENSRIPGEFVLALVFVCFALAFDLLHFLSGTVLWGFFGRVKEKQLLRGMHQSTKKILVLDAVPETKTRGLETPFVAPRWMNWPSLTFFYLKIASVLVGYAILIKALSSFLL